MTSAFVRIDQVLLVPEVVNWETVLVSFFTEFVTDTLHVQSWDVNRQEDESSQYSYFVFSLLHIFFSHWLSVAWLSPSQERLRCNDIYWYILLSFILGRQSNCVCMFICTHTICYILLHISFYSSDPLGTNISFPCYARVVCKALFVCFLSMLKFFFDCLYYYFNLEYNAVFWDLS